MKPYLLSLFLCEDGATAVEYAVMLALIVLACLGTVLALGNATASSLHNSQNSITNAMNGGSS
ncbi:MAG: Flp family type IVb pilin [Pirellulaceae bacterium]